MMSLRTTLGLTSSGKYAVRSSAVPARAGMSFSTTSMSRADDSDSPDKLHKGQTDAKDEGKEPGPGKSGDTVDRKARDAGGSVKEEDTEHAERNKSDAGKVEGDKNKSMLDQ